MKGKIIKGIAGFYYVHAGDALHSTDGIYECKAKGVFRKDQDVYKRQGLYNVQIECLNANDGDHYDPRTDTVRLSYNNYNGTSVTAVSVAAHECGHAIQHAHGYAPMSIRAALVPVVNIGSNLSIPLIFLGVLLSWNQTLIQIGIWAFALTVICLLYTSRCV